MFYSNNYSKYIENIRLEKNKKNFQRLVESTKEDKSEKLVFEDPYSKKESDKSIYVEDDSYDKSRKPVSNEQNPARKDGFGVENLYPLLDSQEYSSIQKNAEVSVTNKEDVSASIENEYSRLDDSIKVSNIESDSRKNGGEVDVVSDHDRKEDLDINTENKSSIKSGDFIIYQYSLSNKDGSLISVSEGDSVKSGENISVSEDDSIKEGKSLIDQIKNEKKRGAGIASREIHGSKKNENLPYLIAEKKKSLNNIGIQTYEFDDSVYGYTKKTEAMAYEHGMKYDYYPAGTYSQITTTQSNAISDFIGTIANPSNWSTPGKTIVNAIKVANDVANMISIVGPSSNIHTIFSENKIRHNLKIDEPWKFGDSLRNSKYVPRQIQDGVVVRTVTYEQQEIKATDRPVINNGNSSVDFNIYYTAETYKNNDEKVKFADLSPEQLRKDFDYEVDSDNDRDKNNIKGTGKVEGLEGEWESNDFTVFLNPNDENRKEFESQIPDSDEVKKDAKQLDYDYTTNDLPLEEDDENENSFNNYINDQKKEDGVNKIGFKNNVDDGNGVVNIEKEGGNFAYIRSDESYSNRWYDNENSLGKIYVIPPYRNLALTNPESNESAKDVAFVIPLQNNLKFEQTSRGATWTAIQFFGRIGDVQQYSRTGSMEAITLTTEYFIDGDTYSMARLQDIEMMYRSLVLPAEMSADYMNNDSNIELGRATGSTYYYFTRPPLINIVLGKGEEDNDTSRPIISSIGFNDNNYTYKNLFTDVISQYKMNSNNSGQYEHNIYYKNFVVTNVAIDKNQDKYNYFVNKEEQDYLDTTGFTVTLTALEIDGNYLGSMPSFNNYYNTVKSRGGFNV